MCDRAIMPYMIVSKQINFDVGPTYVGDSKSDPALMAYLKADLKTHPGNNYACYQTALVPRVVLDMLEEKGWEVISSTGIGQTCVWTLRLK